MISKADIKAYDFNTIEEYFNYIVESEINGQRAQVHALINDLSTQQKKDCLKYLKYNASGSDAEIVKNILITSF